jgi:hypothetical protein
MTSRRGFFKALGGAILGTAIALRLPDSLLPRTYVMASESENAIYKMHVQRMNEMGFKPLSFEEHWASKNGDDGHWQGYAFKSGDWGDKIPPKDGGAAYTRLFQPQRRLV